MCREQGTARSAGEVASSARRHAPSKRHTYVFDKASQATSISSGGLWGCRGGNEQIAATRSRSSFEGTSTVIKGRCGANNNNDLTRPYNASDDCGGCTGRNQPSGRRGTSGARSRDCRTNSPSIGLREGLPPSRATDDEEKINFKDGSAQCRRRRARAWVCALYAARAGRRLRSWAAAGSPPDWPVLVAAPRPARGPPLTPPAGSVELARLE